jgi:hypothetical protein
MLRALGHELRGVVATVRRTRTFMWASYAIWLFPAATVGALPLGWLVFGLQVAGFLLVAGFIVWPDIIARGMRDDDAFEMRERDSVTVVTYLPVAVAFFSLPFYLLAQAVLFWRLMQHFPGILAGSTWGDAWRLSLDNLLFTELFFDLFDIFGIGLAAEPTHLAGRVLVFVTRLLLSIGFVRIAIYLTRAAFYRAHGLGRGRDPLGALERAVSERDAVLVGHLGRELTNDIRGTIDVLLERRRIPERRDEAFRGLRSLSDWVIPYMRNRIAIGDPQADEFEAVLEELRVLPTSDVPPPQRKVPLAAGTALVATAALAVVVGGPAIVGFPAGVACMMTFGWLLTRPRSSYEWGMEWGLLPFVSLEGLGTATLAWSAAVAAAFVLASWSTLLQTAALWPATFAPVQGEIDGSSMLAFVAASMLRVQAFMSIPEVFSIAEPAIEQRPWVGSLLTLALRTGLNLGFVAVVVTGLTIRRDREGLTGLINVPDDLGMRMEALRGGRFAHQIMMYHHLAMEYRLWDTLDAARDADTQDALVASGVFEWLVPHASLGEASSPERLRSHSLVIQALHRQGWSQATAWLRELEAALETPDWPPDIRSQVLARRAVMATSDGDVDAADRLFTESYGLLVDGRDVMDEVAVRETRAVWARSVVRAISTFPPDAVAAGHADPLADRAAELFADLADRAPNRFTVDVLRLGAMRALLIGRARGAASGVQEMERVAGMTLALPANHPWREVLLLQLLASTAGMVALLPATPTLNNPATPGDDPTCRLAALEERLLETLGHEGGAWDPRELAVRAYDERLGEELGQVIVILSALPPSPAAYIAATRTADIFQARSEAGVLEARGYALGIRISAVTTAHNLGWPEETVATADQVFRLAQGMRCGPKEEHLLAHTHMLSALAARSLGRESEAIKHARHARDLYERIAKSDWDGAGAVVVAGLAHLEGFGPIGA